MSLYLEDAFRASGLAVDWQRYRCGPSSYRFDKDIVLVRYATKGELSLAEELKGRGGRVIYVLDDDLESMAGDAHLPAGYRRRIERFLSRAWERIGVLSSEMVVSSAALESKMRSRFDGGITRLDPFWDIPGEGGGGSLRPAGPVRIGWLCSRGHLADFRAIAGEVVPILESDRDVKLVVCTGRHLPKWLRGLDGVENREALPWADYRRGIGRERIDLALYPLLDTAVNRSRSINKFLEHAVVGAATLCSSSAPFADRLRPGDCAFADPGQWRGKLEELLDDPESRAAMARRGRERAREIAEAARAEQVAFWRDRLPGLEVIEGKEPAN